MGGTVGFSDKPEEIWLKAGWAFRQILEDTLARCSEDIEMREAFEQAEWYNGLAVQDLPGDLAERVISALREVITGILAGTVESGITSKPYGDARTQAQYKEALQELLEIIPARGNAEALEPVL